jgi:uncharacterized protein (DUF488 family)
VEIYTIGHSNHTWETFGALLREHDVTLLVDVRSRPVSRWAPFANKRLLAPSLEQAGIGYLFLGEALGGKPSDQSYYDADGRPDYGKIASGVEFRAGIGQLLEVAAGARTVVMCAEEDPATCHRTLLIGPALEERGVRLLHIRKDGTLEGCG